LLIRRHSHDDNDVDDIYQNIFLSLVVTPPSNLTSLPAYLRVVVKNQITDAARRAMSYSNCIERYAGLKVRRPADDRPDTRLMRSELTQTLIFLVKASLPARMADVVLERYVYNRDIGEVAERFGLKRRTVSRYCCVASERIRRIIEEGRIQSETIV
jgi:RNA polymerase sigma factor (sigma-70 family)